MTRSTGRMLLVALLGASSALVGPGCGGSKGAEEPGGGEVGEVATGDDDDGDAIIPQETMDEIQATFDRRRRNASRCLVDAMNAGEIGKNEKATALVTLTITRGGKASRVKVDATPKSEAFASCIGEHVEGMTFPSLAHDLDYSYAFAFEEL
jgi:hypothetical protein